MAEKEIIPSNQINNDQFFEGVEKLIEIWFTPAKNADLRKITRQQWENVLKIVRCEIISFTQSEQVDAYVLRFTCKLYDSQTEHVNVNEVSKDLFASKNKLVSSLPPTSAVLFKHTLRAAYQGADHIWGNALKPEVSIPCPSSWGGTKENESWIPEWSAVTAIWSQLSLLEHCGCKSGCETMCCGCRRVRLPSTAQCKSCKGGCTNQNESSMFVSRRRWILKTCGTTTPLRCLRAVLALARDVAGHARVDNVFYSRREFARPQLQRRPHDNFDSEVELLDSFFGDGRAYIMGPEKDCWYLYTLLPLEGTVDALEKEERNSREAAGAPYEPDQTLEILMSDLDPEVMDIFTRAASADAKQATKVSGIDKIIPGMVIDDFLFDPCGYSMNGLDKDGCYMTIHITPERSCSYVSFESNCPVASYDDVIARVLQAFRPQRFVLTVFATPEPRGTEASQSLKRYSSLREYSATDAHYCRFANYSLHYALFAKFPS